ncbi:hypothetical protein DEI89_12050 [Curtobacterium sp. MCBD17_030]|nr:hypothetical protein DEI89_12050 [Curtobacterium sp. MCBD17_030]
MVALRPGTGVCAVAVDNAGPSGSTCRTASAPSGGGEAGAWATEGPLRNLKPCRLRNFTSVAFCKQLVGASYDVAVPEDDRNDDDRAEAERLLRRQLDRLWVRQTLRTVLIEQSGGLDPTARVILRAVERLGEVRSTAVAERTGLSRPVVSRRIAGLVEAGYVRTAPDPDDGRAALLGLAPAGRALLDGLDAQGDAVFDDVTSVFHGDELRDFARLLTRFNDRAAEVLGAGGEGGGIGGADTAGTDIAGTDTADGEPAP